MRHEMRGQLGDAIQDYDKTGKAGKDRPAWIKNKHCAQLSLVVTQQQWTVQTDEVFDKIERGQRLARSSGTTTRSSSRC